MSRPSTSDLHRLAATAGIQTSYTSVTGARTPASEDGLVGVLAALEVDASTPSAVEDAVRDAEERDHGRVLEPVLVAWDGRLDEVVTRVPAGRDVHVTVHPEDADADVVERTVRPSERDDGSTRLALGLRLPLGYHRLRVDAAGASAEARVIAAPRRAPSLPGPLSGVFVPLLGLRGGAASGIGSFPDLARLHGWLRGLGGKVVATLPMLAAFLDEPFEPSPYSPASRLFWNELFVDPDVAPLGRRSAPRARRGGAPAGDVDVRATMATLRARLEPLVEDVFAAPALPEGLRRFLAERPEVLDYARFRLEVERRGTWWGAWPPAAREGRLRGDPLADPAGRYHVVAQWAAHEQLARVAAEARTGSGGLYLDLPLGVNGAGYDVWRHRDAFATGASAGAPPDVFFTGGQSWGFPPPHPTGIRESGYAYEIACLRRLLASAAFLRIDHVMGLHRLWWVPEGMEPTDGAYVRYRPDEWYAIVTLEASRAGSVVIGEDLGTVPGEVRRSMKAHGLLSSYVVQYEARAEGDEVLPDPPAASLASLNTHDMPTWAAFWAGDDLRLAEEHGWLTGDDLERARRERDLVRARLRDLFSVEEDDAADRILHSLLRTLAVGPAAVTIAILEDLWGERRPVNVPGTTDTVNWTRRVAWSLDRIVSDETIASTLRDLAVLRGSDEEAA